jgi:hypothetical protein
MTPWMAADAWTRLEQRLTWAQRIASALGVLLIIGLLVAHVRDRAKDARIAELRGRITADSALRVAAQARTDTAVIRAVRAVEETVRADSGWTSAKRVAARMPAMVASTKPDTVKIRELVATIDTLVVAGDQLQRAAAADTAAIAQLGATFIVERSAWDLERADLARALKVSESRSRHWGLGGSVGYAVIRDGAGVVRVGPGVTLGITYRW